MNKVELVGRLTRDPEGSTYGDEGNQRARFSVAVNRKYKNADGNYDADFPSCVAFNKTAEFILKYFTQGKPIGITGHIQTGSYTNKDGEKVYTTDVVVDEAEFVGSKSDNEGGQQSNSAKYETDSDGFMNIPEDADDELPFN